MKTKISLFSVLVLTIIGLTGQTACAASIEETQVLEQRGMAARQDADKRAEQVVAAKHVAQAPVDKEMESSPVVDLPVDETDSPASTAMQQD